MFPSSANLALGILGNVFSACINLAPLFRIVPLLRTGDLGAHDGWPYQMMWLSSFLWINYAEVSDLVVLASINAFGIVTGLLWLFIWVSYLDKNDTLRRTLHYIVLPVVFALGVTLRLVAWFFVDSASLIAAYGALAAVVSVAFNVSPLISVAITGQFASIDPILSGAIVLATATWLLYGVGVWDLYVLVSNAVSVTIGVIELILWGVYASSSTANVTYSRV